MSACPAFGVCGYSGSGKTTLIEALVRGLAGRGLRIAVIKQDAHGLSFDRDGKDTDRLFKAGADVMIRDGLQVFARLHREGELSLRDWLALAAPHYDLVLVEGHKTTPLPYKVWLCGPDGGACPPDATGVRHVLAWTEDRERIALELLDAWLPGAWNAAPVHAGILIGGASRRMGRPKHLIEERGATWLERIAAAVRGHAAAVVLLGRGEIPPSLRALPVLPDVEEAAGPLRGMLSAVRWAPRAGWLFAACDQPGITPEAVAWLLAQRAPGVRAVMPVLSAGGPVEPLFAYYDFRMAPLMERARRPRDLASSAGVATPLVPAGLAGAWRNVNAPADLAAPDGGRERGE